MDADAPRHADAPRPGPPVEPPGSWPRARALARRAYAPVERFLQIEAASGLVLVAAALAALVLANSPWAAAFEDLWRAPIGVTVGSWSFERDLRWWINDGLMAVFFFVVGLEIRREMHRGVLSSARRAALPLAAALGGMVVPAAIFAVANAGLPSGGGWGVPMATDIAFAVGVLALLGKRVPPAMRILLLALAVIDDLGAILVIAIFYTPSLSGTGFVVAAAGLLGILVLQGLGVRRPSAYVVPAIVVWAGTYAAGVHPTLAGVALGLATPVIAWPDREASSPAEALIHALHGWVAYLIMPLFALANAGVVLGGAGLDASTLPVLAGVGLGLLVGKPLGILLAAWIAVRLGAAVLPAGVAWRHVLVVGVVAGIGFTMALFIAQLAFPPGPLLAMGKLAVLVASGLAALVALGLGRALLARAVPLEPGAPAGEADAERA